MINWLLNSLEKHAGKVAPIVGKSAAEIRSAISQARSLAPEVNSSQDGGRGLLKKYGVDNGFIKGMYGKYSKYADKIPGGKTVVDNFMRTVDNSGENVLREPGNAATPKTSGFDRSKYPGL